MPPEISAETIEEGRKTLETVARPNVFMAVVAIAAMLGVGLLVWRDEVRADAQIHVLEQMEERLGGIEGRLDKWEPAGAGGAQLAAPAVLRARR